MAITYLHIDCDLGVEICSEPIKADVMYDYDGRYIKVDENGDVFASFFSDDNTWEWRKVQ